MGLDHLYDCPDKQEARDRIYSHLMAEAPGPLMFFPGPRRWEIDTALRHGFPLDKMIPVEKSRGILAALRKMCARSYGAGHPRLALPPCHAATLAIVCRGIPRGSVRAVNFDFCTSIEPLGEDSTRDDLERFFFSGAMESGSLSVELYQGRCKGFAGMEQRLAQLFAVIKRCHGGLVVPIEHGTYQNSRSHASTSMLWSVYRLEKTKRRDVK